MQTEFAINLELMTSRICLDAPRSLIDAKGMVPGESLADGRPIRMNLDLQDDGFNGISLVAGTYCRNNVLKILFILRDRETGRTEAEASVDASSLSDNRSVCVMFPKIPDSKGRHLELEIRSEGARELNTVTFYTEPGIEDPYKVQCLYAENRSISDLNISYQFHDFFSCCPSLFLLGPEKRYCSGKSCAKYRQCFTNVTGCNVSGIDLGHWRRVWGRFLSQCTEYRFFSQNTYKEVSRFYDLDSKRVHVKPHELITRIHDVCIAPPTASMRFAVVGAWAEVKGSRMVLALAERLQKEHPNAQIYFYGRMIDAEAKDLPAKHSNIVFRGEYVAADLPSLFRRDGIGLVVFPSVWPETFSFVVSECMDMLVPIVAFNIGAPADRLARYPYAELVKTMSSAALYEGVLSAYKRFCVAAAARRLVLFVHYDKDNVISPADEFYLKHLRRNSEALVLISNSKLGAAEIDRVRKICTKIIVQSENKGYDFYAWARTFLSMEKGYLDQFDEIVFANNSCFGPLFDLRSTFDKLTSDPCDFGGLVLSPAGKSTYFEFDKHIQSFFLVFKRQVFLSASFREFMSHIECESDLMEVVRKYEVNLTEYLSAAGFTYSALYAMKDEYDSMYIAPRGYMRARIPLGKKKLFSMIADEKALSEYIEFIETETIYDSALLHELVSSYYPKNSALNITSHS